MTKCIINDNNEITAFWDDDETAPENSVICDKSYPIHGEGLPGDETFFYKVQADEDASKTEPSYKVITTDAGKVYTAQEYARNRKEEYDALNQFELISDDDANGTTTHKDAITAIKTKWPKDNSGPV